MQLLAAVAGELAAVVLASLVVAGDEVRVVQPVRWVHGVDGGSGVAGVSYKASIALMGWTPLRCFVTS